MACSARLPASIRITGAIVASLLCAGCADRGTTARPETAPESATPLDPAADGTEQLPPGRYRLVANGEADVPGAVVELPAGLSSFGGFAVGVLDADPGEPFHTLSYWTVSGVYANPCSKKGGLLDAGRSVDDLAEALSVQRLTTSTTPTTTAIDGYRGVELDLLAPDDVVFEDCIGGYFDVWDSSPGGGRYLQQPGQLLRLRILDVDGQRVVIETSAVPGNDQGGLAAVDEMAERITFVQ